MPDRAFRMKTDFATTQGHAENPYNNRCDQLAVAESQKYKG